MPAAGVGRIGAGLCLVLAVARADAAIQSYAFDGPVESLQIRGALTVEFAERAGPQVGVEVESAGERAPEVTVTYQDGSLVVSNLRALAAAGNLVVRVRGAGLRSVQTEGASNVRIDGVRADRFALRLQGSSDVHCSGQAREASFEIQGAGNIDASRLPLERAQVVLNGAGTVDLHATESLDVTIRGVGRVTYSGGARVQRRIDGIGSVAEKL